jgi:hypothetical protein
MQRLPLAPGRPLLALPPIPSGFIWLASADRLSQIRALYKLRQYELFKKRPQTNQQQIIYALIQNTVVRLAASRWRCGGAAGDYSDWYAQRV